MAKDVKLADIAKRLNVSTVTVSKALSGKNGVGDDLRKEIARTADEMGYIKIQKQEEPQQSYNIGVFVAARYLQFNHSFYWQLYQQISNWAINKNCFMMLEEIQMDMEQNLRMPKIMKEQKADAVMIIGQLTAEYTEFLAKRIEVPCIYIDTTIAGDMMDAVVTNNLLGGYQMTSYLLELGHRKVGFVGSRLCTSSIDDRYLGYLKALMEHGIEWKDEWNIEDRDRKTGKIGFENMKELPDDMPTAFFCNCDFIAYLFVRKLEEMGYRIPEDISVVGFDNDKSELLTHINLTTYEMNTTEIAKRAIHILIHKIQNPNYSTGQIMIGGRFVEGESTKRVAEPVPSVTCRTGIT